MWWGGTSLSGQRIFEKFGHKIRNKLRKSNRNLIWFDRSKLLKRTSKWWKMTSLWRHYDVKTKFLNQMVIIFLFLSQFLTRYFSRNFSHTSKIGWNMPKNVISLEILNQLTWDFQHIFLMVIHVKWTSNILNLTNIWPNIGLTLIFLKKKWIF